MSLKSENRRVKLLREEGKVGRRWRQKGVDSTTRNDQTVCIVADLILSDFSSAVHT